MNPVTSKRNNSTFSPSTCARFFVTYHRNQLWSLPDSVIYYIAKNPSTSKCYQKIIQTCKHFFIKKPILVVSELHLKEEISNKIVFFNGRYVGWKNIIPNIWIIDTLDIKNVNAFSTNSFLYLAPKIYQSNVTQLRLFNQNIFLYDLIFLSSKCKFTWLKKVTVMEKDGSCAALEKIMQIFPSIKNFYYYPDNSVSNIITSKTATELFKIPHFLEINDFYMTKIPDSFDIQSFFNLIKKNHKTRIHLSFSNQISENFQIILQGIIDEIVETKNHSYKLPCFWFPQINPFSASEMMNLFRQS